MFKEIYRNELKNILKSPAFYIFFALYFFFSFKDASIDIIGRTMINRFGHSWHNAPIFISRTFAFLSIIGVLFSTVLVGRSVAKDFQSNTHHFFFTSPLSKFSYLFGRFSAAITANFILFFAIILGITIGVSIIDGKFSGPLQIEAVLHAFFLIALPNIIFIGSIFFSLASLSRNMINTYLSGVGFLLIYSIVTSVFPDKNTEALRILTDPTGMAYINIASLNWTVREMNIKLLPIGSLFILNRVIYLGLSACILIFTYRKFQLHSEKSDHSKKVKSTELKPTFLNTIHYLGKLNNTVLEYSKRLDFKKYAYLTWYYLRPILLNPFFLLLTGMAIMEAVRNFTANIGPHSSNVYPFTMFYLRQTAKIYSYMIPLTIVFAGLLVWKERDTDINEITDTLAVPSWITYSAKLSALVLMQLFYLLMAAICGIVVQIVQYNFYDFELLLYFKRLIGIDLINYFHMAVLVLFFQTISPNKIAGFLISATFYISFMVLESNFNLSSLLNYGFLPAYEYSNINGFGSSAAMLIWYRIYWLLLAGILIIITNVIWRQNNETSLKHRLKAILAIKKSTILILSSLAILFVTTFVFIYYNSHYLNKIITREGEIQRRVNYEKLYKSYSKLEKPGIIAVDVKSDFYPDQRAVNLDGFYILKNTGVEPIEELAITFSNQRVEKINKFNLSQKSELILSDPDNWFYVFHLSEKLAVGDTIQLQFNFRFEANGFSESNPKYELAENGSYIYGGAYSQPHFMPMIGYDMTIELTDRHNREENGLPIVVQLANRNDSIAVNRSLSDLVDYHAILSTSNDQTALTNGTLIKEWQDVNRNYYEYKSDTVINNSFVMLSGRYEVKRESSNGVLLEVYYDKKHYYNVDRMLKGMKSSLQYCSKNYSEYPYKSIRIVEATATGYPGRGTATSHPTFFSWTEFGGFTSNLETNDAIDIVFNTTTHEMAHQWWGHNVRAALVEGIAILSETMAQWVRIQTMKQEYNSDKVSEFLENELDDYLHFRKNDLNGERPLARTLNQSYLNYSKGSIVMNSLGEYIGEKNVNLALKKLVDDFGYKNRYPTTINLTNNLLLFCPDSLKYLIADLFDNITLYENKIDTASVETISDNQFRINVEFNIKKFHSDSIGNLTEIDHNNNYLPIYVYGKNDSILFYEMHRFKENDSNLEIIVNEKPASIVIDPKRLVIDRNMADNQFKF